MVRCSSQVDLLKYAADELAGERRDQLARHLESCNACRTRLEEIRKDFGEFEDQKEAGLIRLQRRIRKESACDQKPRGRLWLYLSPAAGLAVLAGLIIWISIPVTDGSGIQAKGLVTMEIIANRQGVQFEVHPGQNMQPQDRLRFRLKTAGPGYLTIVSLDQKGVFSSYYPDDGVKPIKLDRAGTHELPGAVELDDTPGRERIILLFSPEPFDVDNIQKALQKLMRAHPDKKPKPADIDFSGELIVVDINKAIKQGR